MYIYIYIYIYIYTYTRHYSYTILLYNMMLQAVILHAPARRE